MCKLESYFNEVLEELELFETPMERLQFVLEYGKDLGKFPQEQLKEENKVPGCTSNVYIYVSKDESNNVLFKATSEALIVGGYIAILFEGLNGMSKEEILLSEEIIRDQLLRRNEDPQLWLLLSEIQRNSKNIIGYHQSRAEYFLLLGQNEEALSQLEFALSLTKNNFQVSERIMNQIVNIKKEIGESRGF